MRWVVLHGWSSSFPDAPEPTTKVCLVGPGCSMQRSLRGKTAVANAPAGRREPGVRCGATRRTAPRPAVSLPGVSSPRSRLLQAEHDELLPLLRTTSLLDFDRATVCELWSVRDLIAHCSAIMSRAAEGTAHGYTPAENQADVEARRHLTVPQLLDELDQAFELAIKADVGAGVALGVWLHGGDVREALNLPGAYAHGALAEALQLLVERSVTRGVPAVDVTLVDAVDRGLDGAQVCLGDPGAEPVGWLRTDTPGLFRLVAGRRPELVERDVVAVPVERLRMFD